MSRQKSENRNNYHGTFEVDHFSQFLQHGADSDLFSPKHNAACYLS